MLPHNIPHVAIVGAGPAGLMAADVLARGGAQVDLYDTMPSFGRKFLLAGVGGMNLTHAEGFESFLSRYGTRSAAIAPLLEAFPPAALRAWIHDLGIETFVGSSGRVFPKDMKAAPLLRALLHRLRAFGVRFHARRRGRPRARGRQLGAARFGRRLGVAAGGARRRRDAFAAFELRFRRRERMERLASGRAAGQGALNYLSTTHHAATERRM